ncbi:MAG: hypothetical protein NPINA01_02930 [Nitrospinaceae bacterium]|nr:MAG: hypothetical protein NPINA01_02930 [Nitrospinaceae bacterium]
MALPPDFEKWRNIFYVWNEQVSVGTNYILTVPAIIFQTITALPQILGATAAQSQRILFVFWFTIPGLTMYWMMREFVKGTGSRAAALMAVGLYMFNLYQIPMWIGFSIANLCAYATLPAVLVLVRRLWKEKRLFSGWGLALVLVLLIASGTAINPPLMIVLILFMAGYLANLFIADGELTEGKTRRHLVRFLIGLSLVIVSVQSFWIIPFLGQYLLNLSLVDLAKTAESIESTGWLTGISANTGILNVLRMQADWTWYQGWQEPYTTYSSAYNSNIILHLFAWIPFTLAAIGTFLGKGTYRKFFGWATGASILLSMGANGFIMKPVYTWLVENVPLFWIIRSPWYKFGLITALGFAYLGGLGTAFLFQKTKSFLTIQGRPGKVSIVILLFLANLVYTYPLVLGKMFPLPHERKVLPSRHADVPDYVWKTSRWIDERKEFSRIIALPESTSWVYPWGFSGSMPAIFQFSHQPVIYPFFNKLAFNTGSNDLLKLYYRSLYEGWTDHAGEFARLLGSRYILHESDVRYKLYAGDTDDPAFIRERLSKQSDVELAKSFGAWDIYRLKNGVERIYATTALTPVFGRLDTLVPIIALDKRLDAPAFLLSEENSPRILKKALSEWPVEKIQVSGTHIEDFKGRMESEGLEKNNIPISYTWHSQQMKASLQRAARGVNVIKASGFYPEEKNGDDSYWWIESNKDKHFRIINHTDHPIISNLSLVTTSFEIPRTLYAYLNDELLKVTDLLAPDQDHTVIIPDITLQPGENILSLYTPYGLKKKGERQVGFGLKPGSIKVGPMDYGGDWGTLSNGNYRLRILSSNDRFSKRDNKLYLDGQAVFNGSEIQVSKGSHRIALEQQAYENYSVQFNSTFEKTLKHRGLPSLEVKRVNPTEYRIKASSSTPYFLVFNESYNPFWKIWVNGKKQGEHFVVNGYANGYYIDQTGDHEIRLYYWPQTLLNIGGAISLFTILVFGIIVTAFRLKEAKSR